MLIPWQSHDDIYVCTLSLPVLGSDGMDSILECVLSDAHRLLLLRPLRLGA
jgi:hypothetical protein